jgi:ABC-type phosphate/phosphonate transport system substrate-binding protein
MQVDSLLNAHKRGRAWLADSVEDHPALAPGQRIGRYRLLRQLGEGGFSRVFLAEQTEPVQREVALKLLKVGMDTREVVARFHAEQQALALMHHPNIARVFDGGAAEDGLPYFVMELAPGVPITDFCRRNEVPLRRRLELFIEVCAAVEHAHLKGIIHRDLKPSNILVTQQDGQAVPKVIDFGIAKSLDLQLTDRSPNTRTRMVLGTPSHMSPEQADGAEVTKASDLFSLGSVLYELITDQPRLGKGSSLQTTRQLLEQDEVDPRKVNRTLDADLATICLKCLEKDPVRRYRSARALAEDLDRWLHGESIVARPSRRAERLWRWTRRYPAAAGLIASLACGAVVTTLLWWEAALQREAKQLLASTLVGFNGDNIRFQEEAGVSVIHVHAEATLAFSPAGYDPEAERLTLAVARRGRLVGAWLDLVPLILHLQKQMERSLGHSILVDLVLLRDEVTLRDYIKTNQNYIIEVPLSVYLHVDWAQTALRHLVRKENHTNYHGVIVSSSPHGIFSLLQRKDASLVFGDADSALSWNGRARLNDAGFSASCFTVCEYLADGYRIRNRQFIALTTPQPTGPNSRHREVVAKVAKGEFEVGVTYEHCIASHLSSDSITILKRFPVIHGPWMGDVHTNVADAFVQALCEIDRASFGNFEEVFGEGFERFTDATVADYEPLKEALLFYPHSEVSDDSATIEGLVPTPVGQPSPLAQKMPVLETQNDEN